MIRLRWAVDDTEKYYVQCKNLKAHCGRRLRKVDRGVKAPDRPATGSGNATLARESGAWAAKRAAAKPPPGAADEAASLNLGQEAR